MSYPHYFEARPCFVDEASYTFTITVDGTGDISSWTLSATMTDLTGETIPDAGTATVTDGAGRVVTAVFDGQPTAGQYRYVVRRTDDSSNLVVLWGFLDVTDPLAGG